MGAGDALLAGFTPAMTTIIVLAISGLLTALSGARGAHRRLDPGSQIRKIIVTVPQA